MVEWVKGFIIPIIELVFIGGIVGFFLFIGIRAWLKVWKTQMKWFFKYTIRRNKYDEKSIAWILKSIDMGFGYYDAKKILLIKGIGEMQTNEIMWIYSKIIIELEGGLNKDGQRITRSNQQIEGIAKLPTDYKIA